MYREIKSFIEKFLYFTKNNSVLNLIYIFMFLSLIFVNLRMVKTFHKVLERFLKQKRGKMRRIKNI